MTGSEVGPVQDGQLRLKYLYVPTQTVRDAGVYKPDEDWYAYWLDSMVHMDGDAIFFVVRIEENTDMWPDEPSIDRNEVRYLREAFPHELQEDPE